MNSTTSFESDVETLPSDAKSSLKARPHKGFFVFVSANTVQRTQNISAVRRLLVLELEKCEASSYTFTLFQLCWNWKSMKLVVIPSLFSSFNLIGHRKFEIFDVRVRRHADEKSFMWTGLYG